MNLLKQILLSQGWLKNPRLWLAALCIPLIEIAVLLASLKYFGAPATYAILAGSTLLGLLFLRLRWPRAKLLLKQSMAELDVYRDDQNKLQRAGVFDPLAQWVLFWVTGLLLLIPGFATDVLAFALMLPPIQRFVLAHLFDFLKPRLPRL